MRAARDPGFGVDAGQLGAHRPLRSPPQLRDFGHVEALQRQKAHVTLGRGQRPGLELRLDDIGQRAPRDGKYLEQIGTYNPLLPKDSGERVKLDEDRARYWLGVGAQATDRVARFLDAAGVKERAARNNPNKAEPGEKAKERVEERAAKATAAEEAKQAADDEAKAAKAAAAAAPAVEETPAEEAPAEEAPAEDAPAEDAAPEAPADDVAAEEAPAAEEAGEEKAEG